MQHTAVISVENLSVQFGGFTALHDVSTTITNGKITGLIGPSGAGKTTLMRCIVGRQRPSAGTVTVLGSAAGSPVLRSRVSYKTQEVSIYRDLTVAQNLRYFATMMNVPKIELVEQVNQLIAVMGMQRQTNQLAGSLSGGQKQRVSLAIALIGNPELLILDEPTVGLDPILRDDLWTMFRQLANDGASLLISSHVMDEAERCDDLMLIRDGQIVAHQTPAEMRRQTKSKTIEQSFLKLARESTQ